MNGYRQTKPVRRAAPPISRVSAEIFSALARKTKFVDPNLADNWPSLVGAEIAELARPGRLTGTGRGRTLELYVRSGAEAARVQMHADQIIAKINRYLGPGSVGRIAVRQNARSFAESGPDESDDGALGQALASFRNAIKRRNGEK